MELQELLKSRQVVGLEMLARVYAAYLGGQVSIYRDGKLLHTGFLTQVKWLADGRFIHLQAGHYACMISEKAGSDRVLIHARSIRDISKQTALEVSKALFKFQDCDIAIEKAESMWQLHDGSFGGFLPDSCQFELKNKFSETLDIYTLLEVRDLLRPWFDVGFGVYASLEQLNLLHPKTAEL